MGQYASTCRTMLDNNESLLFFSESMFDEFDASDEEQKVRVIQNICESSMPYWLNKYNCSTFLDENESLLFFTDETLSPEDSKDSKDKENRHYHNRRIGIKLRRVDSEIRNSIKRGSASSTPRRLRVNSNSSLRLRSSYEESRDEENFRNKQRNVKRIDGSDIHIHYKKTKTDVQHNAASCHSIQRQRGSEKRDSFPTKDVHSYPINAYGNNEDDYDDDDDDSTDIGLNSIGSYSVPSYTASDHHRFVLLRKKYLGIDHDSQSSPSTIHTSITQQKKKYDDQNNLAYSFSFEQNIEDDDFFSLDQSSYTESSTSKSKERNNLHHYGMYSTAVTKTGLHGKKDLSFEDITTTPTTTTSYSSSGEDQFYVIRR